MKKNTSVEVIEDEVQRDIEVARNAAKRRMEAPEISMSSADAIPQDEMLKIYCPECHDRKLEDGKTIKAKWHAFIGDRNKHELYLSQGYEPVVYEGKHVKMEGGDPVYRLPMPLHERNLKENLVRSRKMLGDKARSDKDRADKSKDEGGTLIAEHEYDQKQIDASELMSVAGQDTSSQ